MSIGHLLDHTCDVYRLTTSKGTFRETVNSYTKVYEGLPCTFQRRNTVLGLEGPGERPIGDRRIYLDTGPTFQDRDIISVVTGPEGFFGPQNMEVQSIAAPRGHHIELRGFEWVGTLPDEGS